MTFVNLDNLKKSFVNFKNNFPFPYAVIDNFFKDNIANQLASDFPDSDSDVFNGNYFNAIEIKRTCNVWDRFPPTTYKVLQYLNSQPFLETVAQLSGQETIYADVGLHGGGWHIHPPAGKLNVHLDYSIHPKMGLQRKFNLLIYLNPNWQPGWGGELGLWTHNEITNKPKDLVELIEPRFNRAVIFDTTGYSWHGLEVPNNFPKGQDRKSLALYYLIIPPEGVDTRNRALFSPSKLQENDKEVEELIKRRSMTQGNDPTTWSRS